MTNAPDDYREPKITTVPAKKSSASYIPWLLLALGILVFLAWLFGAFDTNNRVETGATPASNRQRTTCFTATCKWKCAGQLNVFSGTVQFGNY